MDKFILAVLFLLVPSLAQALPLGRQSAQDMVEMMNIPTTIASQRLSPSQLPKLTGSEESTQGSLTSATTEGSSGTCLLSSDQVQNIQSPTTDLLYMVVNKQVVAHQSLLELYVQLHRIVTESAASQNTVTDIWLSRAPCKLCQEILEFIFAGASTKPTIHIESWQTSHNQTATYRGVLQSMGCISKLKSQGYPVVAWDWKKFQRETDSTSCDFYTDTLSSNVEYSADKDILKQSLPHINGFQDFCV